VKTFSRAELARQVEVMLARAEATRADVEKLCQLAREQQLYGLCLSTSRLELASALLEESGVKLSGLVGFPLGAADADTKRFETEAAIDLGAHEIEMVVNLGRIKDQDYRYVLRELRDVAEAADERPVKAILEFSVLTPEEKRTVCELLLDSGVQFLCTGTGFLSAPNVAEIDSLRTMLGPKFGIKAAGVGEAALATALIEAGANRLGTVDALGLLAGVD
jgi:deoxyribose-phosphate aldolase